MVINLEKYGNYGDYYETISFITLLLVVAVAASGCTRQNVSNKIYSAKGVSFIYPGNWSEQNATSLETDWDLLMMYLPLREMELITSSVYLN
jgi:hypothetical protein